MGANSKYITFIMGSVFLMTSNMYAEVNPSKNDALAYTNNNMKDSLVKFGEKIKVCTKKETDNPMFLNVNEVKNLNITSNDFNSIIVTLNYSNYDNCVKKEEREYIYNSLLYYHVQSVYNNVDKDILDPLMMSLPTTEILEARIKYDKLPVNIKEYFEKVIGSEPFDIVKVSLPILKSMGKVK